MFAGAPTRLSFDWDAVARLVASPFDLRGSPLLQGLTILGAGEHGAAGQTPTTVWSAFEVAGASASALRSGAGELRERLDACVGAMGRNSRLPEAIANRRAKGDYAAYFNQQAAANLPFLRDYLLGGRLADRRILDQADMEARLDPDRLLWRGGATEILAAVSTEAWVRRWEARMTSKG